jgi:dsDNA-specific endonuclease/ATPase MutS2
MQFLVGDKVRLMDDPGEGHVTAIQGDVIVAEIDGIEMSLTYNQLVKVEFDALIRRPIERQEITAKEQLSRIEGRRKLQKLTEAQDAVYELDLHMHELLDRFDHMTNGQRLSYQMSKCRSFVREAIDRKYRRVVLIHGVGEGVLRSEIHRWLETQNKVEFHDAPYRTYGYGATEVISR